MRRPKINDSLQTVQIAFRVLSRQRRHNVHIYITKSRFPRQAVCLQKIFCRMHPSKQSQFPVVQRLRADTDPVYSRPPAAFQFFDIHCSGIRFYGDLRFLSKRKPALSPSMILPICPPERTVGVPPPRKTLSTSYFPYRADSLLISRSNPLTYLSRSFLLPERKENHNKNISAHKTAHEHRSLSSSRNEYPPSICRPVSKRS